MAQSNYQMKTELGSAVVWSWIAGFWEGEGYAGCTVRDRSNELKKKPSRKYYSLQATMCQKDKRIIYKIRKFLNKGNIYHQKTHLPPGG